MDPRVSSSVFYQYCDVNYLYVFKSKDDQHQCLMKVYDLAHTCIKKHTIALEELAKLPLVSTNCNNIKEMVGWLVQHNYTPSLDSQNGFAGSEITQSETIPNSIRIDLLKKISTCTSFLRSTISLEDKGLENFCCPITHELMRDPVIDNDGHSFEREAIKLHLQKKHLCPLSNKPITSLTSNLILKATIEELQEKVQVPQFTLFKKDNLKLALRNMQCGDDYEEEGELEEALVSYTKALSFTNKWEDYQKIPPLLEKMGRSQEAALSYLYLVQYQWEKDLWKESLNHLIKASELHEDSKILALLAQIYYALGDKDKGHEINFRRGAAALEKKNDAEAALAYQEIIECDPSCEAAYEKLFSLASTPSQKALLYLKRALHFFYLKDLNSAQVCFEKAYSLYQKSPLINHLPYLNLLAQQQNEAKLQKICLQLAKIYEKKQSTKDLINCYKILIAFSKQELYYEKLIKLYQMQKKSEKVVHWTLAWMDELVIQKQWKKAEKICLNALNSSKENPVLLEKLEEVYSSYDEEKLLDLWMRLGEIYQEEKQFEKAASFYRKAYDRFQDQGSLLALAAVLVKLGHTKESIKLCFKAANCSLQDGKIDEFNKYLSFIEANDPQFTMLNETQKVALVAHRQIYQLTRELEIEKRKNREIEVLKNQINAVKNERDQLSNKLNADKYEKDRLQQRVKEAENALERHKQMPARQKTASIYITSSQYPDLSGYRSQTLLGNAQGEDCEFNVSHINLERGFGKRILVKYS